MAKTEVGLLLWRPRYNCRPIHSCLMLDKVTLGQFFPGFLFSAVLFHQCAILIHLYVALTRGTDGLRHRNLPESNTLSEIGEKWIAMYLNVASHHPSNNIWQRHVHGLAQTKNCILQNISWNSVFEVPVRYKTGMWEFTGRKCSTSRCMIFLFYFT